MEHKKYGRKGQCPSEVLTSERTAQLKLYNIKIILSVVFIFSILVNILIVSTGNFQESNDNKNNNKMLLKPNAQLIIPASQTAYLNLINSFITDGIAYGLDVYYSDVWIADGKNGIVKLMVNPYTGVIHYEDRFYNGGTAYDVVYKSQWGNQMLVVADGEDGLEILDPDFDDLFPGLCPILSYGGGSIENNTRCVAVYNHTLYDPSFDLLTYIYTQEWESGTSEVEAVYIFWDPIAILAGDWGQTASITTVWPNLILRVYVSGTYLYTAGWSGVNIYSISNPASLSNFVAHCPDTQFSNDVFVQGNYLYVADNNELVIIDITNPSTPVNLSSFDEFDGGVTKIFVDGNYAYLADLQGINIVDISNPASPEKIGSYAVSEIYDIYVEDGFVYLAAGAEGFLFLELEVVEDTLSITSPSLEQTGKNCPLSWTSQGDIPYVKISLYSGGIFSRIITANSTNDGSFNWVIPGDIASGTSYSIRIEDASNPAVMATSNEFEIYTNSFSFSSSYEGITWETGKEYCILWESTGYITSVDFQLLKEGGVIHDIAIGTDNDGEYDCFIPVDLEPSTEYQLKISDHADPSISLTSETFTIKISASIDILDYVILPLILASIFLVGIAFVVTYLRGPAPKRYMLKPTGYKNDLKIDKEKHKETGKEMYMLTYTPSGSADRTEQSFKQLEKKNLDDIQKTYNNLLKNIRNKVMKIDKKIKIDIQDIKEIGSNIYSSLITKDFQNKIENLQLDYRTIELKLGKQFVQYPWELVYFGDTFLALQCSLGRYVDLTGLKKNPKIERPSTKREKVKVLIIADPEEKSNIIIPQAKKLKKKIKRVRHVDVELIKGKDATYSKVREKLREGADFIHFFGHARSSLLGQNKESFIQLSDKGLKASEIAEAISNKRIPFLVFINACESGQAKEWTKLEYANQVFDLPSSFIINYVEGFIGSLWPIHAKQASYVAKVFYKELFKGKSFGRALQIAKQTASEKLKKNSFDWASYVLFGNPNLTLEKIKKKDIKKYENRLKKK